MLDAIPDAPVLNFATLTERKLCGKPGWKFRVQYKKDGHLNFGVERTDVGGVFFNVFVYLDYQ
jgi:hypothetical protein